MALNQEDQNYYDMMFSLTSHEGWRDLVEQASEKIEQLKNENITTRDPVKAAENRGAFEVLSFFICNFREGIENGYEEALKESEGGG